MSSKPRHKVASRWLVLPGGILGSAAAAAMIGRLGADARWTDIYWGWWLFNLFALFFPVELGVIFAGHSEMTLSDTMWDWTNDRAGNQWRPWTYTWPHWLLIIFMVLLTLHLCFRVPLAPWRWGDKGVWPW